MSYVEHHVVLRGLFLARTSATNTLTSTVMRKVFIEKGIEITYNYVHIEFYDAEICNISNEIWSMIHQPGQFLYITMTS